MHVLILGAGVIGVTTAYYLSRHGYRATFIDRAAGVARGASHANGGQLSYSFTDAFAQPSVLPRLPGYVLGLDPGIRIGHPLDPAFLAWAARFVVQCTRRRAAAGTLRSLSQALRSRALLEDLRGRLPFDFGYRKAGKLVLLRNRRDLIRAAATVREKRRHGCDIEMLTRPEANAIDSAVAAMDERFCGAIYGECDEVADARAFTERLYGWLVEHAGAAARLETEVLGLDVNEHGFRGVRTPDGTVTGDAAIICLGADAGLLARSALCRTRVMPVRGYSLTLPKGSAAPRCSVTDLEKRILFSALPSGVRITGFMDFVGFSTKRDTHRLRMLKAAAERTAPEAADYRAAPDAGWAGLRPMTPDGQPVVGPTPVPGVFTNLGHGSLGWTLAFSTAFDAAAAVDRWRRANGNKGS